MYDSDWNSGKHFYSLQSIKTKTPFSRSNVFSLISFYREVRLDEIKDVPDKYSWMKWLYMWLQCHGEWWHKIQRTMNMMTSSKCISIWNVTEVVKHLLALDALNDDTIRPNETAYIYMRTVTLWMLNDVDCLCGEFLRWNWI